MRNAQCPYCEYGNLCAQEWLSGDEQMLVHTLHAQRQGCVWHTAKPHTPAEKSTGASGPCKPRQGVVKMLTCAHLPGLFTVQGRAVPLSGEELRPLPLPVQGPVGIPCLAAVSHLHIPVLLRNPCTPRALRAAQAPMTSYPGDSLGTGEPSLRNPQMPHKSCPQPSAS